MAPAELLRITLPSPPEAPAGNSFACPDDVPQTRFYTIATDGRDTGREVRSAIPARGATGEEVIYLSHVVQRYRARNVEVDRLSVQAQRFASADRLFLRGSDVDIDERSVRLSLVGFNGAGWDRVEELRDSVLSPLSTPPGPANLTGEETIGLELNLLLQDGARRTEPPAPVSFFRPKMVSPVPLECTSPRADVLTWRGERREGFRMAARRAGTTRDVLVVFVDGKTGLVLEEQYPPIHEIRTLSLSAPPPPREYANAWQGLFSDAYLGLPGASTHATYHIVSVEPVAMDDFAFLGTPENQTLRRIDRFTLQLDVRRGAPDGTNPPDEADLAPSPYINSDAPVIVDAFRYLKSGGRNGSLPTQRRGYADRAVAEAARIERPAEFWSDPAAVAGLVARYVHQLLPDKTRTQTMKDASSALSDGMGDCTEHAVLFAALMRTAGVPARLVSGMYLARGGSWEFHMWNEFHDGRRWQAIDSAIGPTPDPGAHYVSLSRGASDFAAHRNHIAFFLDRSFSGLAVNLVAAGANGEALHLAAPARGYPLTNDAVAFETLTLIRRGSFRQAERLILEKIHSSAMTLDMEILLAELAFRNRDWPLALSRINALRRRTSLPANVLWLDELEFNIAVHSGDRARADDLFARLAPRLADSIALAIHRAALLHLQDRFTEALATIDNALLGAPDDPLLLQAAVDLMASRAERLTEEQETRALALAQDALLWSHYAQSDILKSVARLYRSLKQPGAETIRRHALLMTPDDPELNEWKATQPDACAPNDGNRKQ